MSSKRRMRRNMCSGKARHVDADSANIERKIVRRNNPGTPRIDVYRCPFCKGFHIGHARGTGLKPS